MSQVALEGTGEVEENRVFYCLVSTKPNANIFFKKYLHQLLLKSKVRHRLQLTTTLSNAGVLTRAALVYGQSLKEKEDSYWRPLFPGMSPESSRKLGSNW